MLDLTQHEIGILLFLASTHLLWCTEEKPLLHKQISRLAISSIMHVYHTRYHIQAYYRNLNVEPAVCIKEFFSLYTPSTQLIALTQMNTTYNLITEDLLTMGAWNLFSYISPQVVGWMRQVNNNHKSKQKGRKEDLGRHEKDANERKINGPCKDNDSSTFSSLSSCSTILRERERLICKSNQ